MPLRTKRFVYFLMAALGGFLLWYCSPALFGAREPWDGNVLHYGAALITIGLALRLLMLALPISVYFGVLAGQMLGMLWPGFTVEGLFPLGAILLLLFSLLSYFGAWFGQHIR